MAVLDGLRLLIGCRILYLRLPEGSSEPIWVNPAYQAFRLRIDKALDKWDKQDIQDYVFDPTQPIQLLPGSHDQTPEWVPIAIDSKVPYYIVSNHLKEANGGGSQT